LISETDKKVVNVIQRVFDALALLPVGFALQELQIMENVVLVLFYNK